MAEITAKSRSAAVVEQKRLPAWRAALVWLRLRLFRFSVHGLLLLGAIIMLFPFYWMLTTSVKEMMEALAFPPTLIPQSFLPTNYVEAWNSAPFARYFVNTIFISVADTVATLITASLAGYAFARLRFWGRNVIFMLFLATMMVPFEVTLVPNFVIIKHLGWYNTYLALIVPWCTSVFGIFLLRQFFMSLPRELYDAALIDGCGDFGFWWRIAMPLARPGLVVVALFTFLAAWNSLLWPLIVTGGEDLRVIQVGLSVFQSEFGTRSDLQMAAAAFCLAPVLALYFFAQRYFVEAITFTGIHG